MYIIQKKHTQYKIKIKITAHVDFVSRSGKNN